MYKTVLFDLDGTLLNTIDDLAASGNRVCAARGWPEHTVEQFKYFVGNGIPKLVERLIPEGASSPLIVASVYADFMADYKQHLQDKTAPYPGMAALLAELKRAGVQLAVLSNKDDTPARRVVEHYFGADLFEIIRGARQGMPHKPAAAPTLALLEDLHADPAATLYVGDSDVDVQTAHNAALPCCGVLWGFRTESELRAAAPEFVAATPAALKAVILGG